MKRTDRSWMVVLAAVAPMCGCVNSKVTADRGQDAGRSPNATILPAPLATVAPAATEGTADAATGRSTAPADSRGRLIADAGIPTPQAMIPGEPLASDSPPWKDVSGATLRAEWIWTNVPGAPHAAEVAPAGIDAARKATRRLWTIDLAESGRMRIVFDSASFTLTKYTELRARYDRYGHALVWPATDQYRVVPPGALRALMDERRVDVTPLMPERAKSMPSPGPRFGFPVSRAQLSTATGKLVVDQAHVINTSLGGPLLCRTLVELVSTDPSAATCAPNMVPVRAEYTWPDGSTLGFEVESLSVRSEFPTGLITVPPATATFTATGLPPEPAGVFLTRDQMAAFRSRAADSVHPRTDPEFKGAPGEGFIAKNPSDALRFVLIDGVAVAWVRAHDQQYLIGTARGRYVVQWRSFLGSFTGPATTLEFPALITLVEGADAAASERDH
jgi:hypothetical protein